jgi:autotransporter-associated beta strand protein
MFGPFYIGFNAQPGTDLTTNLSAATSLYNNEVQQIPSLNSFYDTESELVASGYVPSTARGDVTATATSPAGWNSNPYGNLVILADNDVNFQNSNLGDEYWGYINPATNQVSIPGVVPGTYRLSITELGQWGETRLNNVPVNANLNTILQGVKFTPENFGTSIWTIGTPDRSSQEFEYGNVGNGGPANNNFLGAYDYWGGLANSPVPGAVVYYATAVGSTPATNNLNAWPFNYWQTFDPALYAGVFTNGADTTDDGYNYVVEKTAPYVDANGGSPATYKGPDWQVHFTVTQSQLNLGKYLDLSVGLVAAESSLIVSLNGHSLTWHYSNIPADDPMERSGTTGYYQWIVYQWDTSDLNPVGQDDELTFGLSQGDGVMWDALRMEISATGANPTTTGWHDYEFLYNSTDTPVNDALGANNGGSAVSITQAGNESAWLLSGGGSWGVAANWANGTIPQHQEDIADFTGAISGPSTITLDGNRTVGQINFNNANAYTLAAGSGGILTLDNAGSLATITDAGGAHFITAPVTLNSSVSLDVQNPTDTLSISGPISGNGGVLVSGNGTVTFSGINTYGGATTITGGTLLVAGPAALPAGTSILNNTALSIQAGSSVMPTIAGRLSGSGTLIIGSSSSPAYLRLAPGSGTISESSLVINPGSTLDIATNALAINFTAGNDPAATIRSYLQTGYNGGAWTGAGIVSSIAAGDPGLYSVGYADGNTDAGTPAAANQVFLQLALAGDANLDGIVNFADLLVVAQNYGKTGEDWAHGDFNYDGIVNFPDLLLVAQNYGQQIAAGQLAQLPQSFIGEWQLAQAEIGASAGAGNSQNVPEPSAFSLEILAGAGMLLALRRRARFF